MYLVFVESRLLAQMHLSVLHQFAGILATKRTLKTLVIRDCGLSCKAIKAVFSAFHPRTARTCIHRLQLDGPCQRRTLDATGALVRQRSCYYCKDRSQWRSESQPFTSFRFECDPQFKKMYRTKGLAWESHVFIRGSEVPDRYLVLVPPITAGGPVITGTEELVRTKVDEL